MRDYVKDGLMMRKAPLLIYREIEYILQNRQLTKSERKDLEKQLKKAKQMANKTSEIFGRFNIEVKYHGK